MSSRLQPWARIARRIRVPLGFLFAAIFIAHLRYRPPTYTSLLLSLLLVLPGAALRAYASGYVKKNEELTTTGPYAYTRNPLYLGSILMAFGFTFAARSPLLAALLALLFAVIYLPVIRSEEAYLRDRFPGFSAYTRQVPRLFPRLTPSPTTSVDTPGRFSPALYLQHREYNSALGAGAIYLALLLAILWKQRHL